MSIEDRRQLTAENKPVEMNPIDRNIAHFMFFFFVEPPNLNGKRKIRMFFVRWDLILAFFAIFQSTVQFISSNFSAKSRLNGNTRRRNVRSAMYNGAKWFCFVYFRIEMTGKKSAHAHATTAMEQLNFRATKQRH